jgi:DNA polymerase-3 subunit delta
VLAFERSAALVVTRPVGRDELPRWVTSRLAERGVTLDAAAARLLAERVERNLLAAQQEIERIALACPGGSLDEAAVASLVADSARYDVFELATAAFAGDAARALRILAGLRAEGQEPPLLLWALLADLRALSRVAQRLTRTRSIDDAFRAERVWVSRQPALRAALPRLSRPAVDALIVAAARADRMAKGALAGDAWLELEALVARIAGVRLAA